MPHSIRGLVALAAGLLALAAAPAAAFTSQPFGGIHRRLTEAGLAGLGLSKRAIARAVDGNSRQDWEEMTVGLRPGLALFVPNRRYEAAHHFDRGRGEAHAPAFRRGCAYLGRGSAEAAAHLRAGRDAEGLVMLGRVLHTLQDFYSHSNFVDLSEADRQAVGRLLAGASGPAPVALKLTGYDRETGHDPAGDPFGHDAYSKDAPEKNAESGRLVGDRTKHEAAVAAAVAATRDRALAVRTLAGSDAWRRLARY